MTRNAARACSTDMQHRHSDWTCSIDMQLGHATLSQKSGLYRENFPVILRK
jgi:hypothetical protein